MGCAKILTTDFAITPELPEPASLNASRLADYRVGLAGPASPRESVNKISVCGGLGGHGNRGFEYISLGWVCQPASGNQTPNICLSRGYPSIVTFLSGEFLSKSLMRDNEAFATGEYGFITGAARNCRRTPHKQLPSVHADAPNGQLDRANFTARPRL